VTDPQAAPRARRLVLCLALGAFFGLLGVLAVMAEPLEELYVRLEMRHLPAPTRWFLALSRFVRTPLGIVVLTLTAAAAIAATLRGSFDARLKALFLAVCVGGLAVAGISYYSHRLPTVKITDRSWWR